MTMSQVSLVIAFYFVTRFVVQYSPKEAVCFSHSSISVVSHCVKAMVRSLFIFPGSFL